MSSSQYLQKSDLLNKYLIKSVYKMPKVSGIILQFNLKNFIKSCSNSSSSLEIESYLLFYLLYSLSPYLTFNLSTLNRSVNKLESGDYTFKVFIREDKDVYSFLYTFFLGSFYTFKKITSSQSIFNKFCYNISLPSSFFLELEDFIRKQENYGIDLDSFFIDVSLLFENTGQPEIKHNIICNIFPF